MVLAAIAIVRERENGTLEQLLVTPIDPLGLMLGKLAPYLFVGLVEMALILFVMRFGFGVPIRGSLVFLFAHGARLPVRAARARPVHLDARARPRREAQQMAQMFLLPSIFLSGYIFPIEGLPFAAARRSAQVLPATHMVEIMRGVVLRDAGPGELMPHVLALALISTVLVALSVRNFRKVAV